MTAIASDTTRGDEDDLWALFGRQTRAFRPILSRKLTATDSDHSGLLAASLERKNARQAQHVRFVAVVWCKKYYLHFAKAIISFLLAFFLASLTLETVTRVMRSPASGFVTVQRRHNVLNSG